MRLMQRLREVVWGFRYGFLDRAQARFLQNKRVRRLRTRLRRQASTISLYVRRRKSSIKRRCRPLLNRILRVQIPLSPCPQLLQSNFSPSDSDIPLIHAAIRDAKKQVASLTTSASLGQPSTRTQKRTLEQLDQFIHEHEATLSPVRRLPLEIIQCILQACSDDLAKGAWNTLYQRPCPPPPWHLGHICGPWRRAALSMSGLWTTILIELGKRVHNERAAPLKEILLRTRGAPLRLTICSPPSAKTFGFNAATHPLLSLLLDHAEQWGDVMFLMCTGTLASFASARGRLHALHTIWLVFKSWPPQQKEAPPSVIDFLENAPRLTSVTVSVFGESQTNVLLPWKQLQSFTHTRSNPSVLRRHLPTLSPSLRRLTLTLTHRIPCPDIYLPCLRELRLKAPCSQTEDSSSWMEGKLMLTDVLSHLVAPALKIIQLEFDGCPNSDLFDAELVSSLTAIVTRGAPSSSSSSSSSPPEPHVSPLQKLSIKVDHRSSRPLPPLRCLKYTPKLTHLTVEQISKDDLYRLGQGDQDTFLPILRQLVVRLVVGWDTSPGAHLTASYIKAIYDTRCQETTRPLSPLGTPTSSTSTSTSTSSTTQTLSRRVPRRRIDIESPRQNQSTEMWKMLEQWDDTPALAKLVALKNELCDQFPGSLTGGGVPRIRTCHIVDALSRNKEESSQGKEWFSKTESALARLEDLADRGRLTYRDIFGDYKSAVPTTSQSTSATTEQLRPGRMIQLFSRICTRRTRFKGYPPWPAYSLSRSIQSNSTEQPKRIRGGVPRHPPPVLDTLLENKLRTGEFKPMLLPVSMPYQFHLPDGLTATVPGSLGLKSNRLPSIHSRNSVTGFLYYLPPDPIYPKYRGVLRFRALGTGSTVSEQWANGYDVYHSSNRPWSLSLLRIASHRQDLLPLLYKDGILSEPTALALQRLPPSPHRICEPFFPLCHINQPFRVQLGLNKSERRQFVRIPTPVGWELYQMPWAIRFRPWKGWIDGHFEPLLGPNGEAEDFAFRVDQVDPNLELVPPKQALHHAYAIQAITERPREGELLKVLTKVFGRPAVGYGLREAYPTRHELLGFIKALLEWHQRGQDPALIPSEPVRDR